MTKAEDARQDEELPLHGSLARFARTRLASVSTMVKAIDSGELKAYRPHGTTVIFREDFLAWIKAKPADVVRELERIRREGKA